MDRRVFTALAAAGVVQAARVTESKRAMAERVFAEANRERRVRSLRALVWSEALAAEARRHSEEMERRGFFSHTDPKLGNLARRLERAGIEWNACAENLYMQSRTGDPAAAVAAWLRSRGHRANLLSATYRESAAGVAVGSRGRILVTQIFLA